MDETEKKSTAGKKKRAAGKKSSVKKKAGKAVKKSSEAPAGKKTEKKEGGSGGERKYTLDSVLVINNAQTIHGQLNALVDAGKNVVIDASAVEMADTCVLQLLTAFVMKLQAEDLKATWLDPSSELLSRAKMLDLSEKLGLPEA